MPDKKRHGTTTTGVEITDELVKEWNEEAERGYERGQLRPRGRPPLGSAPGKPFPVRLDPELRKALEERAHAEGQPASEVVRAALRRYLEAS
jgi:predicted transcriptional regulator